MTSENPAQPKANQDGSDAFKALLQRNRNLSVKSGLPIDDLIARQIKDRRDFAALSSAVTELERVGAGAVTHARVARCEMSLGLIDRAIRSWKASLGFERTSASLAGLGIAYFQTGDINAAIAKLQDALAMDQSNLDVLESLAVAHLYLGDLGAAKRFATKALSIDPDRLESRLCRARAEIAAGNFEEGRQDLRIVQQSKYKEHETRLLEVDLFLDDGDFEVALYLAAELCERHPDSRDCLTAFRRSYAAFDASDRSEDLADFLAGLDHFAALGTPRSRPGGPDDGSGKDLIDVIVPVHNAWGATDRCLTSVLSTDIDRLGRIIVVNDDSDPKVRERLAEFAETDRRITLIDTPSRLGFTRSVCLGVARSDAGAFVVLNSDTVVTDGWLGRLWTALRSSPDTGMVGPMSNNAAWQNYGAALSQDGVFAGTGMPQPSYRKDVASVAAGWEGADYVPVHFLHGFCVMVDRAAYDACDGLDQEIFPEGYGEFQDLSLRMRAKGLELLVATDCIVFHEKGASLSNQRRERLSSEGRKSLYRRYAALNYLCLEMANIRHPSLEEKRDTLRPVLRSWFS